MRSRNLTRFARKLKWFFSVYLMPAHVATIKTKNGILSFNSKDRTLGRSLSIEREFEYDQMHACVDLLTKNNFLGDSDKHTVMDVGGYIGMIGIGFITAGLFKKALMFEPNPDSFSLIKRNIAQNNMQDSISAYNLALSDNEELLIMELSHKNFGDHRIRKQGEIENGHYNEQNRKTIKVRTLTFDKFVSENRNFNFDDIKMIWIDIQGHEGKFISGAEQFLKEHSDIPVAMEFWPYGLLRSGTSKESFCSALSALYTHFYVLDEHPEKLHQTSQLIDYFDNYAKTASGGCHLVLVNKQ